MRLLRFIIPVIIIAISVAGFVFLKNGSLKASSAPDSDATKTQPEVTETAWDVFVQPVRLENLAPQIVLHGRFETPRETTLSAAITADVQEVNVLDGATVTKGDVLVRLDDMDARLLLTQREADLAEVAAQLTAEERAHKANEDALKRERRILSAAQRSQERLAKLADLRVGSESILDDARVQVQQSYLAINSRQERIDTYDARIAQLNARKLRANAGIDSARRDIERSSIRAPFSGRITAVDVSPGERVRAGETLASIYDLAFIELRVQIPERYLTQLRSNHTENQSITAHTQLDGQTLVLNFDRFAGKIARGRGGVDALFRLQPTELIPDIGRTVSTTVDLPVADNVAALPAVALYGSDTVYTVDADNRLRGITVVRIGNSVDSEGRQRLLIKSDALKSDSRIVVSQLPSAVDGMLVNPVTQTSP